MKGSNKPLFVEHLPWNQRKKLFWTHLRPVGEPYHVVKYDVGLGSLDPADVIPVNGTQLGELLLGEPLQRAEWPFFYRHSRH
jgi:hypothetical protein